MRCNAAVLYGRNQPFRIEEIEVDDPKEGEVMVRLAASGLCHSDYHLVTGHIGYDGFPVVAGHEGAGVIEKVGPGVTKVRPGDHVVLSFVPPCGHCRWCVEGLGMLCDRGGGAMGGMQLDGTTRMHTASGQDIRQYVFISTYSEYTTVTQDAVVAVPEWLPMESICIVGCAVPTGFGAAVNRAEVKPGETVVIFGIGGVGINAVQGSVLAGAARIIAVDVVDSKLELARQFGATHTFNNRTEDVVQQITDLTWGVGADKAIVTIDEVRPDDIGRAMASVRKNGRAVIVGMPAAADQTVAMSAFNMVLYQKELMGCLYGTCNPHNDIRRALDLYQAGKLRIDELVTTTYKLGDINEAFDDMVSGKNLRGVIVY